MFVNQSKKETPCIQRIIRKDQELLLLICLQKEHSTKKRIKAKI